MYLSSPALPIGAFAWSRGLESACFLDQVKDVDDLGHFLSVSLRHSLGCFDLPVMGLAATAFYENDLEKVFVLNDLSLAGRESYEFGLEEQEGGRAVKRLMVSLDLWPDLPDPSFCPGLTVGYALLAVALGLELSDLTYFLESYAFGWLQNQIAASARILKIGQSSLQNLILVLAPEVSEAARKALRMRLEDLGSGLVGLAVISARHEQQPARLFRS
jgi:urease accessory protein